MTRRKVEEKTSTSVSSSVTVTPTVIKEFKIGGRTCEIIRVHGESEKKLSTEEMIKRGSADEKNVANMYKQDAVFLSTHVRDIPTTADYSKLVFLFPLWTNDADGKDNGFIRVINKTNSDWWCLARIPNSDAWDNNHVLARFHSYELPPATK